MNHATNFGMPSSSGVAGAKPVRVLIASIEAQVSSTSASGRGTLRIMARRPSSRSSRPTSVLTRSAR